MSGVPLYSLTSSPIEPDYHRRHRSDRNAVKHRAHLQIEPNEVVRAVVGPHWTSFIPGLLATVTSLFVIAVLGLTHVFNFLLTAYLLFGVAMVSCAAMLLAIVAKRRNETIITNRRLIIRKGFIDHHVREVPIGQITNISCHGDLFQEMLGSGNVVIDVGGIEGSVKLPNVPDPEAVVELITHGVDSFETGLTDGDANTAVNTAGSDPLEQIHKLALLVAEGSISQEEYAIAKRKLLQKL